MKQISKTASVCPVCLKQIPAARLQSGSDIYLQKHCPEHGSFQAIIWRGPPDFQPWHRVRKAEPPQAVLTRVEKGCPFDCGLCPEHRRQSCCVLLEVTERCNLVCPVCFAGAGSGDLIDPPVSYLREQLQFLLDTAGSCNVQLSGGEPTVRDDLPEIIAAARTIGFPFVQLNTNGLRLAEDTAYVRALKEAGLGTVFLQFDGLKDEIYRQLRGRRLLSIKKKAIENCALYKLGVILVPTLVPGVNTGEIGAIIDYALQGLPVIRGVHFQPISYFGRYPAPPADRDRLTLPEVLAAIESQTGRRFKIEHFAAAGYEHTLCSFHGDFLLEEGGALTPLTQQQKACCCRQEETLSVLPKRNFIRKRWAMQEQSTGGGENSRQAYISIDQLLNRLQNKRISISCMAFQDAENLDLERVRDCCLHVVSKGRIIPFCAFNLTDRQGKSVYRERHA